MFHVDPSDPTPVETQLVRTVTSAVAAGLLAPGDALPTVRQLSVELRINANAIDRAFARLAREGVVELRPGVGVFVRAAATDLDRTTLYDELTALEDTFLREAAELGFSLDEVIIHLDSRRKG